MLRFMKTLSLLYSCEQVFFNVHKLIDLRRMNNLIENHIYVRRRRSYFVEYKKLLKNQKITAGDT